jgi:hypothetical protein
MARRCCALFVVILCTAFVPRFAWSQDQQTPPPEPQQTGPKDTQPAQTPQQPNSQDPPQNPPAAQDSPEKKSEDKDEKKDSGNEGKKDENGSNPAQAVADKTKDVTIQAAQATKDVAQATLTKVRDWESEWVVGAYVGRNRKLVPLTLRQREDIYLQQTWLTPGAYLKRMFDAGIDQARGVPRQWDGGTAGYAERFASREGQFFASNSLAALGNAKLHYEVRYDQCRCHGFWPRTRHAIVRNFLTYNNTESELRPQWALYGGAFGGGVISTAWKPKPRNPVAEGGRAMLGQAGFGALLNIFTEFALDINRKLGATQPHQ